MPVAVAIPPVARVIAQGHPHRITARVHDVGEEVAPDDFTNIMDAGSNTVRMTLRYHAGDWWDGDRDRHDTSRQRAEVKGIGPHQKPGEMFEYATTWRTSTNFYGSGNFLPCFPAQGD